MSARRRKLELGLSSELGTEVIHSFSRVLSCTCTSFFFDCRLLLPYRGSKVVSRTLLLLAVYAKSIYSRSKLMDPRYSTSNAHEEVKQSSRDPSELVAPTVSSHVLHPPACHVDLAPLVPGNATLLEPLATMD